MDIPRHELLVKNAVQGIKRSERENRALATVVCIHIQHS